MKIEKELRADLNCKVCKAPMKNETFIYDTKGVYCIKCFESKRKVK